MDESTTGVPPARPFGGITIDRRISAVPAFPRPRSGPEPDSWPLGPSRPTDGPGGRLPSEQELIERTLAFSGSYVSDDGTMTITRSAVQADAYSGDRFVGRCAVCAAGLLVPADGEPLADVREAVRFVATHDHGGLD
jgi:hypothetical protein